MADLNRQTLAAILAANERASLRGLDLSGIDASDLDFRQADLTGTCLQGANLRNAKLMGVKLCKSNLRNASLSGADLRSVQAEDSDLRGAIFGETTQLDNANFERCDLDGVFGFRPSRARGVRLSGAWWNKGRPNDEKLPTDAAQKPPTLATTGPKNPHGVRGVTGVRRLTGAASLM